MKSLDELRAAVAITHAAYLEAIDALHAALMTESGAPEMHPRIARIQAVVAEHYALPVSALLSDVRTEDYVRARHVAIYLCTRLTTLGSKRIGAAFNRDHGLITHALSAIQRRQMIEPQLTATLADLETRARKVLLAA